MRHRGEAPDGSGDPWRLDSAGNSVCSEDAEATVGLVVWPDAAGRLAITGFIEGSDAQRSGLESGDVIVCVDGHSILGLPADEASSGNTLKLLPRDTARPS